MCDCDDTSTPHAEPSRTRSYHLRDGGPQPAVRFNAMLTELPRVVAHRRVGYYGESTTGRT